MFTEAAGELDIEAPRDRAGTFEPVFVRKRQRRLSDVDAVVISRCANALTTSEISAQFAEVYGASPGLRPGSPAAGRPAQLFTPTEARQLARVLTSLAARADDG